MTTVWGPDFRIENIVISYICLDLEWASESAQRATTMHIILYKSHTSEPFADILPPVRPMSLYVANINNYHTYTSYSLSQIHSIHNIEYYS
jgi:hypothetical protein